MFCPHCPTRSASIRRIWDRRGNCGGPFRLGLARRLGSFSADVGQPGGAARGPRQNCCRSAVCTGGCRRWTRYRSNVALAFVGRSDRCRGGGFWRGLEARLVRAGTSPRRGPHRLAPRARGHGGAGPSLPRLHGPHGGHCLARWCCLSGRPQTRSPCHGGQWDALVGRPDHADFRVAGLRRLRFCRRGLGRGGRQSVPQRPQSVAGRGCSLCGSRGGDGGHDRSGQAHLQRRPGPAFVRTDFAAARGQRVCLAEECGRGTGHWAQRGGRAGAPQRMQPAAEGEYRSSARHDHRPGDPIGMARGAF